MIIVIVSLFFCFALAALVSTDIVNKDDSIQKEIMQLMLDFKNSDGAASERIVYYLEKSLVETPNAFLKALRTQESGHQDTIIFHVTQYPFWDGDDRLATFRSALISLKHGCDHQTMVDRIGYN